MKKVMGRPRIKEKDKPKYLIATRYTESEYKKIVKMAKKSPYECANRFVRSLVREAIR